MLVLHIEADTIDKLMRQALDALGLGHSGSPLSVLRDVARNAAQESPPESAEPEPAPETKPKRGRPPRPPVAETEAIEVPPVDAPEDNPEPEIEQPPLNDPIADEKVKAEVIRTLQTIYNSGKVQVIRHVLAKYGEGAKSFPEIEASRFPAIREALARGEIA